METEKTPEAATNGMTTNGNSGVSTEWTTPDEGERTAAAAAAAGAGEIAAYMDEGTATVAVAVAAEPAEQRVEAPAEQDEVMGEAEYLEDEELTEDGDLADKNQANEQRDETETEPATKETTEKGSAENVEEVEGVEQQEKQQEQEQEDEEQVPQQKRVAEDPDAQDEPDGQDEQEEQDEEDVEEEVEEEEEEEEEEEVITGDDAHEQLAAATANESAEPSTVSARSGAQKQEEPVDENQCRVCTSKEQLVCLFTKTNDGSTPVDMLLLLCPSVSIAPKDFMPQFICPSCLDSLKIAIKLRKQLETTEQDLRKRLSRSKNKVRRPRGYLVIDAPISDSASDEDEEELNDEEFKVSDVANSTSADSDSADSDISEKRKPGRRRGRKKGTKRAGNSSNSLEEDYPKKRSLQTSPATSQGPFECDQCDLSFPRKQSYVMHRKTHDSRYDFHCQICNKKFKVRGAFKTHMERHEAERAQFRCELCSAVFRLRVELKRHMATRHDEHGVIYECKRCQRTFLTQTRLQRHQSTLCIRHSETKMKPRHAMEASYPSQGRDLFRSVAPPTTTYWSDSFSD